MESVYRTTWVETCVCGHAESSDGYGGNDCPNCGDTMTVVSGDGWVVDGQGTAGRVDGDGYVEMRAPDGDIYCVFDPGLDESGMGVVGPDYWTIVEHLRHRTPTRAGHRPRLDCGRGGSMSNAILTARNGGVVHQFLDDIGGCSANYR